MSNSILKVTVISDLHCIHPSADLDDKNKLQHSTILYSDLLRKDSPPKHPVHSLLQEISVNSGDVDPPFRSC